MKQNMNKAIALLLVLMLSISILAGCGGGLSGKYVLIEMTGDDGKVEKLDDLKKQAKEFYDEMEWDFDESEMDITIEFLSGDKFKMTSVYDVEEGTFKVDGKNVTLSHPDQDNDLKGTINGNKITFEEDDFVMVFEKK